MTNYETSTVEVPGGYGYHVSADGADWLCQPFDPAAPFIDGVGQPYATAEAAQAAAGLAIAAALYIPEPEAAPAAHP